MGMLLTRAHLLLEPNSYMNMVKAQIRNAFPLSQKVYALLWEPIQTLGPFKSSSMT